MIIFDPQNRTVFRDGQKIQLTPKASCLLHYLSRRTGRLVSKQELLSAVWQTPHRSDGVIKVTMHEIRKALADDAASPRFIETVHCRGYRFIGKPKRPGRVPATCSTSNQNVTVFS